MTGHYPKFSCHYKLQRRNGYLLYQEYQHELFDDYISFYLKTIKLIQEKKKKIATEVKINLFIRYINKSFQIINIAIVQDPDLHGPNPELTLQKTWIHIWIRISITKKNLTGSDLMGIEKKARRLRILERFFSDLTLWKIQIRSFSNSGYATLTIMIYEYYALYIYYKVQMYYAFY